jgi:hypothetical protein
VPFVVHPTIDHVHALRSGGRAHVHEAIVHEQVDALHHLHAHPFGEERVLQVRGVVNA